MIDGKFNDANNATVTIYIVAVVLFGRGKSWHWGYI